jgi:hypothetical protein
MRAIKFSLLLDHSFRCNFFFFSRSVETLANGRFSFFFFLFCFFVGQTGGERSERRSTAVRSLSRPPLVRCLRGGHDALLCQASGRRLAGSLPHPPIRPIAVRLS